MMKLIPGLPDVVVGIEASDEIEDDDYEDVLRPAVEDRLSRHAKIRLLYVLGEEYEGYDDDAVWEDAKFGTKFFTSFERIAVVTDATWVRRSVKLLGWMMPGEFRYYPLAERAAATAWITADV
jgi:SpoIIAA-like